MSNNDWSYDVIAIHITKENNLPLIYVAIDRGNGWWKAYKNNRVEGCGYPVHRTDNINERVIYQIARTGIALDKKTALKFFPCLIKKFNEN